ncbi:YbaB/EbfC family nucleoid-associated protein [Rhodococcus spelaei]|nr:YbaB/EbfC family nucleoid-associated protein [Rhodococcus spelaei]
MTSNELGHKVARAQSRLDGLHAMGEAGGGVVRLRLTADCRLVALDIDPRALDLGAQRVAALVTQAHESARDSVRRAADEVLGELTGDPSIARALDLAQPAANGSAAGEGEVCEGSRTSFLVDPLGRRQD